MNMSSEESNEKHKTWLDCQFHDPEKTSVRKPDELGISNKDDPPLSNINGDILNRIRGSIVGLAMGDALGAHVEFRPQSYLAAHPVEDLEGGGTWGLQKGQFTDDTSMALCLANSLIACKGFVPYDQLVRYKWWYQNGYMSSTGHCFDIGAATRESIEEFEKRQKKFAHEHSIPFSDIDHLTEPALIEAFDVQCSKEGIAGNGALMRLAPVPLFFFHNPVAAVEYSGVSGQITHGDVKAYDACRYYAALIAAVLNGEKKDELFSEEFYTRHQGWFGNNPLVPEIMNIIGGSYKKQGGYEAGIRGKGYVVDALEAAMWAFWSDKDSFKQGALNAVNLGDDTDTTAAIYGQLAGAYYGYDSLPNEWLQHIYANNFLLCVSNWIAYEGQQWFKSQAAPNTCDPIHTPIHYHFSPRSSISSPTTSDSHEHSSFTFPSELTQSPIVRKAIQSSGNIGCFYDGWRDSILEFSPLSLNVKRDGFYNLGKCIVKSGDKLENRNILRLIDFDADQRLSLFSKLVAPNGIASAIDYPFEIDECTRIFYYCYSARHEVSLDDKSIQQQACTTHGSHIITAIDWGIDVVVLLRLPPDNQKVIHGNLIKICQCLQQDRVMDIDANALKRIISTHVYSNLPQLAREQTILDVYHKICETKQKMDSCQPCNYILRPINVLYPNSNQHNKKFMPIEPNLATRLEDHWLRLLSVEKIWTTFINNKSKEFSQVYAQETLAGIQKQFEVLKNKYNEEMKKAHKWILELRCGKLTRENIEHDLNIDVKEAELKCTIDNLRHALRMFYEKEEFIQDLIKKKFYYWNPEDYGINKGDDEKSIQNKLVTNPQRQRLLCSNDKLNAENWQQLESIITQMQNEFARNPEILLVYVDFSFCKYNLEMMRSFPKEYNNNTIGSLCENVKPKENKSTTYQRQSSRGRIFNIVLIGKTRIGKSTLINAIANYFKFNRLIEFESIIPSMLVVISFMYRVKCSVEQHFIRLGAHDPNEDHNHSGQSITQGCKAYVFDIGSGQRLRIIDTPGFSDTQSATHNDRIMQHILSYMLDLPHIDAICVMMQLGDMELTSYSSCLTSLLDFMGAEAYDQLTFCFTKCLSIKTDEQERQNLGRRQLQLLPLGGLHVKNDRIFLFDSTFFIHFATVNWCNPQQSECKESWSITKNGFDKFLKYVRQRDRPYALYHAVEGFEATTVEILQLIRPITEAMRNLLQNCILINLAYPSQTLNLFPKHVHRPSAICYSCPRSFWQLAGIWITLHSLHLYPHLCEHCLCDPKQHVQVDYDIEYVLSNQVIYDVNGLLNFLEQLRVASGHFAHFLMNVAKNCTDNPVLAKIDRMVEEENVICDIKYHHVANSQLLKDLLNLKNNHNSIMKDISKTNENNNLNMVRQYIDIVKDIPLVKDQIKAAKGIQETRV